MKAESVELNDIEMYYEMEGTGEPLLLLHGGTGCQEDWIYSGRDQFASEYAIIKPDARGHGKTSNPQKTITHRQCALDTLALLDHLGIEKCRAIGLSMGGNILLHMATLQPERIEAMVVVSATMYFPEQTRAIMRQIPRPTSSRLKNGKGCARATSSAISKSQAYGTGRAGCRTATTI
jgi:pimeloyl-ACP methyl ester carboxylesterase